MEQWKLDELKKAYDKNVAPLNVLRPVLNDELLKNILNKTVESSGFKKLMENLISSNKEDLPLIPKIYSIVQNFLGEEDQRSMAKSLETLSKDRPNDTNIKSVQKKLSAKIEMIDSKNAFLSEENNGISNSEKNERLSNARKLTDNVFSKKQEEKYPEIIELIKNENRFEKNSIEQLTNFIAFTLNFADEQSIHLRKIYRNAFTTSTTADQIEGPPKSAKKGNKAANEIFDFIKKEDVSKITPEYILEKLRPTSEELEAMDKLLMETAHQKYDELKKYPAMLHFLKNIIISENEMKGNPDVLPESKNSIAIENNVQEEQINTYANNKNDPEEVGLSRQADEKLNAAMVSLSTKQLESEKTFTDLPAQEKYKIINYISDLKNGKTIELSKEMLESSIEKSSTMDPKEKEEFLATLGKLKGETPPAPQYYYSAAPIVSLSTKELESEKTFTDLPAQEKQDFLQYINEIRYQNRTIELSEKMLPEIIRQSEANPERKIGLLATLEKIYNKPVEQTPVEQTPVEQTPVEQTPVEQKTRMQQLSNAVEEKSLSGFASSAQKRKTIREIQKFQKNPHLLITLNKGTQEKPMDQEKLAIWKKTTEKALEELLKKTRNIMVKGLVNSASGAIVTSKPVAKRKLVARKKPVAKRKVSARKIGTRG
jgi:hypothetical protein